MGSGCPTTDTHQWHLLTGYPVHSQDNVTDESHHTSYLSGRLAPVRCGRINISSKEETPLNPSWGQVCRTDIREPPTTTGRPSLLSVTTSYSTVGASRPPETPSVDVRIRGREDGVAETTAGKMVCPANTFRSPRGCGTSGARERVEGHPTYERLPVKVLWIVTGKTCPKNTPFFFSTGTKNKTGDSGKRAEMEPGGLGLERPTEEGLVGWAEIGREVDEWGRRGRRGAGTVHETLRAEGPYQGEWWRKARRGLSRHRASTDTKPIVRRQPGYIFASSSQKERQLTNILGGRFRIYPRTS